MPGGKLLNLLRIVNTNTFTRYSLRVVYRSPV